MFKLAMAQMAVECGAPAENRAQAAARIAVAAGEGAEVVLLPETMDVGWTYPDSHRLADEIPGGKTCEMLREAARKHSIYLCSGLCERQGDHVYNSALLIDPAGEILLLHRKLNELGIAHPFYAQGDRLGVAQTPLGTIGVMICADAFAEDHVITRTLGYMGAEVILSPSAWAVPAAHDNAINPYGDEWRHYYGPVARQFQMTIAGCSSVGPITAGPWQGSRCIGCSLIVGPDSSDILQGPYGADVILYANISPVPRPARGCGWVEHWNGRSCS